MVGPQLSLIVGAFNMSRELPRTVQSLSPMMQRNINQSDYEIIIVDNGSTHPIDEAMCRRWGADVRVLRIPRPAAVSPIRALNTCVAQARGNLVGVMVDGARIASPQVVSLAMQAQRLAVRAITLTHGFHLGHKVQMRSVREGYNQKKEDDLLRRCAWTEDAYRLFDISVFSGSSSRGWFAPMAESNALFMHRSLWDELGGFDERFETPGGGLANSDLFSRAIALRDVSVLTLLGEGTFHQVHGGAATNSVRDMEPVFRAEYVKIRGHPYQAPSYRSLYLGTIPDNTVRSILASANLAWRQNDGRVLLRRQLRRILANLFRRSTS